MLLMQSTAAARPPARSLQAPLLWRALAALTLLLSSFGSPEGAQQGDQIAAASQGERAGGRHGVAPVGTLRQVVTLHPG